MGFVRKAVSGECQVSKNARVDEIAMYSLSGACFTVDNDHPNIVIELVTLNSITTWC